MMLKHECEHCESKYKIMFTEEDCADNPRYCPFCSEYIIEEETEKDEDY
jgi:hypothetical protein